MYNETRSILLYSETKVVSVVQGDQGYFSCTTRPWVFCYGSCIQKSIFAVDIPYNLMRLGVLLLHKYHKYSENRDNTAVEIP